MSEFSLAEAIRAQTAIDTIAASLDAMTHAERLSQIVEVAGRLQGDLFEMAEGRTMGADYFVPDGLMDTEVIHWGRNFAPAFNRFQKRFARVGDEVVGYNEQTFKAFTGPGCFVGEVLEGPGGGSQFAINYTKTPKGALPTWPAIQPSGVRLGRFVYGGAHDWMWKVSEHVSVGRPHKKGRWEDQWFLLTREDVEA